MRDGWSHNRYLLAQTVVLGLCLWALVAGVVIAVVAPNGAPGVALAVVAFLVGGAVVESLMLRDDDR